MHVSYLALYTAISRKVVGKSAQNNPEGFCEWFCLHCSSKKFERMTREAMDICLQVLKESSKSRFDCYSVRNSVSIIYHISFWDCRVHIFSDNLSRNSCIHLKVPVQWNLDLTKCKGTGEICSLYRGFVTSNTSI